HISAEILDAKQRRAIAFGAGLTAEEVDQIWQNGREIIGRIFG
ncbi:MAG: PHP domain-containing protein, partial [Deltaproteobacteria bacterium]|nr:PHP domain-containing protein [Deltaproteobacteria bacterium]